jgi:hypothetical protein
MGCINRLTMIVLRLLHVATLSALVVLKNLFLIAAPLESSFSRFVACVCAWVVLAHKRVSG